MRTKTIKEQIRDLDRQLMAFVGLATDPQASKPMNSLLDQRFELMVIRDRGFRMIDHRRVTPLT